MNTTFSFRSDFAEFSDPGKYTDQSIALYLALSAVMMNQDRWDAPAPFSGLAVKDVNVGGAGYLVGDVLTLLGGNFPSGGQATLAVDAIGGGGSVAAAHATAFGSYRVLPTGPLSVSGGAGAGAKFDLVWSYGDKTLYDFGQELFVAHNLVLDARSRREASNGNEPGWMRGPINNASVDKATVGYDTQASIEEGASHWNLTTYGVRFKRMMNMVGAGPLQVINVGDLNQQASNFPFTGPPFTQFPNPSG